MDWRRLVTDDANETDLLRSYAVRVTDATFGYEAEEAAAESGVTAADGRERMWTLFERGALRLVGPRCVVVPAPAEPYCIFAPFLFRSAANS
jgi:hypothetical protein